MRRIILTLVAGALVAAVALPALAASTPTTGSTTPAPSHSHWFAGSVSAVGLSSLTVGVLWTGPHDSSLNGQSVIVSVDSNTAITSGKDRTPVALSSIQNGDLVGVVASGAIGVSGMTATKIHVYCNCHWIGGTISSIGTGSITVQVAKTGPYDTVLSGQAVTVVLDGATSCIVGEEKTSIPCSNLKLGQGVGVVFSANGFFKAPGFDPSKATFTAKQIHVWGHKRVPGASTDSSTAAQVAA